MKELGIAAGIAAAVAWLRRRSSSSGDVVALAMPILRELEGFRSGRYWDYQQYSIGYGSRWEPGMPEHITEQAAAALLETRIRAEYLPVVQAKTAGMVMTASQKAALLSMVYNCGAGCVADGTWWTAYKAGNMESARHRMLQWINPVPAALLPRRKREWYMLRTGQWNPQAATMAESQLPL